LPPRWSTVNLDTGELHVSASLQAVGGGLAFLAPKTKRSRRTITLPPDAAALLRRVKREQAERRLAAPSWIDTDAVFDRGNGEPMSPSFLSHAFAKIARKAGHKG
jgi:integrase